jgi:hypothetical protein
MTIWPNKPAGANRAESFQLALEYWFCSYQFSGRSPRAFGDMNPALPIALFFTCVAVHGAGFRFPSSGSSWSPNARWELVCKSPGATVPS